MHLRWQAGAQRCCLGLAGSECRSVAEEGVQRLLCLLLTWRLPGPVPASPAPPAIPQTHQMMLHHPCRQAVYSETAHFQDKHMSPTKPGCTDVWLPCRLMAGEWVIGLSKRPCMYMHCLNKSMQPGQAQVGSHRPFRQAQTHRPCLCPQRPSSSD